MDTYFPIVAAGRKWLDPISRFFSNLAKHGDDRYFHPHSLTRSAAEKIADAGGKDAYFIMVDGSSVVGYGMLRGWDEGYAVPSLAMAVDPNYRQRGLGRQLLAYLHGQARARGADQIRLKAYPSNRPAVALYESAGYRFSGQEDGQRVGFIGLYEPEIFVSSSCAKADTISEAVEQLASHGIGRIELSGGTRSYDGIYGDLFSHRKALGIRYLVHNYFPPAAVPFVLNIASPDRRIRNRSIEFVEDSLAAASRLHAPFYAIHPGYVDDMVLDEAGEFFLSAGGARMQKDDALQILEESVRHLCRRARSYGLMFGVENLFPGPDDNVSLLCDAREIDWLFDRCSDVPNLGLLVDLGHAHIAANLMGFDRDAFLDGLYRNYSARILGIHVSDNRGARDEHRLPPPGNWMVRFIEKHRLQRVPITIEARNAGIKDIAAYCRYLGSELGGEK